MRFSFSTPKEITRGMKRIWESKMGTPSSARIVEDVDMALKALEIVLRSNWAVVKGLAERNGPIRKVVGEGKSVTWGGAQTKGANRNIQKFNLRKTLQKYLRTFLIKFAVLII